MNLYAKLSPKGPCARTSRRDVAGFVRRTSPPLPTARPRPLSAHRKICQKKRLLGVSTPRLGLFTPRLGVDTPSGLFSTSHGLREKGDALHRGKYGKSSAAPLGRAKTRRAPGTEGKKPAASSLAAMTRTARVAAATWKERRVSETNAESALGKRAQREAPRLFRPVAAAAFEVCGLQPFSSHFRLKA